MTVLRKHRYAASAPVLALVLLAGCSTGPKTWSHPEIPADEWSVDAAQCKHEAQRDAEEEYLRDDSFGTDTDLTENSVAAYLDRAGIDKRAKQLFANCMRSFGYVSSE